MPTYEYFCLKCNKCHDITCGYADLKQELSDLVCKCGSKRFQRIYSPPAIKGSRSNLFKNYSISSGKPPRPNSKEPWNPPVKPGHKSEIDLRLSRKSKLKREKDLKKKASVWKERARRKKDKG